MTRIIDFSFFTLLGKTNTRVANKVPIINYVNELRKGRPSYERGAFEHSKCTATKVWMPKSNTPDKNISADRPSNFMLFRRASKDPANQSQEGGVRN